MRLFQNNEFVTRLSHVVITGAFRTINGVYIG